MKRQIFLSNLLFLIVLNALVKPFWLFGIEVNVQNAVGAEDYGLYYSLLNFTFLFNILLDLGINNFQNRESAREGQNTDVRGMLGLKLILAGAYAGFCLLIAWWIGYDAQHYELLGWLIFNMVLVSFIQFFRANLAGLHLFKRDSVISVLDRFLMILGIGILLWADLGQGSFDIRWFVWVQSACYAVTLLVAAGLIPNLAGLFKGMLALDGSLTLLRKTMPYAIIILLMMIYYKTDGIMLERLYHDGAKEAGIYAQAYRLLEAGNIVGYLFAGLLLPMFARMIKSGEEELTHLVDIGVRLLVIPSMLVTVWAVTFSEEIMSLLYEEHIRRSAAVLSMLMVSFIALSSGYIFGTLITASGNLRALNVNAGVTVLINLGLNFVLIPDFGALGAACASMVSMTIMALAQIIIAHKYLNGYPRFGWILAIAAPAGAIIICVAAAKLFDRNYAVMIGVLIMLLVMYAIASGVKPKDFKLVAG